MPKPVNQKCLECSKVSFKAWPVEKPECWEPSKCTRKRNYYKYLDKKRAYELRIHHYNKYRDGKCVICDSVDNLQSHHIQPQSIGGLHTKDNIATLCGNCHSVITKYYQAVRGLKASEG
jgi:uncharacterized protein YlaI